jgi:hypothetical protein
MGSNGTFQTGNLESPESAARCGTGRKNRHPQNRTLCFEKVVTPHSQRPHELPRHGHCLFNLNDSCFRQPQSPHPQRKIRNCPAPCFAAFCFHEKSEERPGHPRPALDWKTGCGRRRHFEAAPKPFPGRPRRTSRRCRERSRLDRRHIPPRCQRPACHLNHGCLPEAHSRRPTRRL